MKDHQACFPIATLCRVIGVSCSGFYAWRKRVPSARAHRDAILTELVRASHTRSDGTYGAPPHLGRSPQVRRANTSGAKRVARLMRAAHLVGVHRRRTFHTTQRGADESPAADLVKRDFTASMPNQLWVADITYVPTWTGFLYLAVVLDAYSRRIVGWSMTTHLRTPLVLDALDMALQQRCPSSVIHHSDHGSQGGFNRTSQHLLSEGDDDEDRQAGAGSGRRRGRSCGHLAGRRCWPRPHGGPSGRRLRVG